MSGIGWDVDEIDWACLAMLELRKGRPLVRGWWVIGGLEDDAK